MTETLACKQSFIFDILIPFALIVKINILLQHIVIININCIKLSIEILSM